MAKELKQNHGWFSSELLCDGLYLGSERRQARVGEAARFDAFSCISGEFPYGFGLNPEYSPVESAVTEECDYDEYLARLTRRMAYSFLQDDEDNDNDEKFFPNLSPDNAAAPAKSKKIMAGTPHSTLCSWSSPVKKESSIINGPALVPSPLISPLQLEQQQQQLSNQDDESWGLLCEATGQVMRLRLNDLEHNRSLYNLGLLSPSTKKLSLSPVVSATHKGAGTGCYTSHILAHRELQAAQFHHLKQQQLSATWGLQSRIRRGGGVGGGDGSCGGYCDGRCSRPLGLGPDAWPPLKKPHQQQPTHGSGMRALFLNSTGMKKESAGTGVFLPRPAGGKIEPRKKPACSTVLVPAKVLQALNLNLEELGGLRRVPAGFVLDHDALVARNNAVLAHLKRNPQRLPHHSAAVAVPGHETPLPQEWTY